MKQWMLARINQSSESLCCPRTSPGRCGCPLLWPSSSPQALTPLSPPAPPHRYLYLLFSEDNVLSPEDWVFNTEAHPLPVNHSDSSSKAGHHH